MCFFVDVEAKFVIFCLFCVEVKGLGCILFSNAARCKIECELQCILLASIVSGEKIKWKWVDFFRFESKVANVRAFRKSLTGKWSKVVSNILVNFVLK